MAAQYVKERNEKIAKEKASKMSKEDKEAAKGLKESEEGIPELTPPKKKKGALSQREKRDKELEKALSNEKGLNKINIGGEEIVVGPLGDEDASTDEDLRS